MSFFWGALTGAFVGVYFAEKNAPFPLSYRRGPNNSAGELALDLQICNIILNDARGAFEYPPTSSTPSPVPPN